MKRFATDEQLERASVQAEQEEANLKLICVKRESMALLKLITHSYNEP